MAFSSIHVLSFALVQVIFLSSTVSATIGTTISIQLSKSLAVNSTDDYLLPLIIGTPPQTVYLNPSTSTDDAFVISPEACTPAGNTTALEGCVKYRGGVFGPKQSSSYIVAKDGFTWKDDQYALFADGNKGQDTITLAGDDDVALKEFTFGLVGACNMTSGLMGLGPNSKLLAKLVEDGKISSRSYGIHVGIDIENHAYPILDPTFDDSGEKPYDSANYNSGVGKFKRDPSMSNETVGEVHSFPGYLTLGGYDKTRIDNRTVSLKAPITSGGKLELELTNMLLVNQLITSGDPSYVFNETRKVIIDSSTPYIYLPETTAQKLSYALGATYGSPLEDFYYGDSADNYIRNITFKLQIPGGAAGIDIVIPPSVLYQNITALRDYIPVGNDLYSHYLPIKTFKDSSDQPIVLGRTFLKAAYLFINHDSSTFQLSQVLYTNDKPDIVAVATLLDEATASHSTVDDSTNSSPPDEKKPPIALIAAVSGATGVFFALGVCFLLWRRKRTAEIPQDALQPIPSTVTIRNYGNELDGNGVTGMPMINLPQRDEKHPLGPGHSANQDWGVWEQQKDGSGGYYTPHPLAAGGMQYHEMESDYVGMATSPSQAYPPQWAELPATPAPVHPAQSQHPAFANQQNTGSHNQPYQSEPEMRYEM